MEKLFSAMLLWVENENIVKATHILSIKFILKLIDIQFYLILTFFVWFICVGMGVTEESKKFGIDDDSSDDLYFIFCIKVFMLCYVFIIHNKKFIELSLT